MAGFRECAQCGDAFTPRREHARFCSAACRRTWNRRHAGVAAAPGVAIDWSVAAMTEAAERFGWSETWDLPRAAAAVSEMVWWITLIDATLVRYHPREYENTLAQLSPARRRRTEETLGGLRYVRNLLGHSADPAGLIRPAGTSVTATRGGAAATGRAAAWTCRPLSPPALVTLPSASREWELDRYRAYQVRLAGRDVARAFARCATFLERAATAATAAPVTSAVPAAAAPHAR